VLGGEVLLPLVYNPDLPLRQIVIWARAGGINCTGTFYVPTHEWICIFAKPAFRLRSKGASGVGDVWYFPQEPSDHPAPFPLALAKRAIETVMPQIVLDPFAGRGTTLKAAKNLGIKSIGVEIEERFCEMAARWLEREGAWLPSQLSLLSGDERG
jgi:modification methylase